MIFRSSGSGRVVINGVEIVGDNISISGDGTVTVDGAVQARTLVGPVNVEIYGNPRAVETASGDVTVSGSAGSVQTTSGDVRCGDVSGSVQTVSGDVTAQTINGGARSVSGDIRAVR